MDSDNILYSGGFWLFMIFLFVAVGLPSIIYISIFIHDYIAKINFIHKSILFEKQRLVSIKSMISSLSKSNIIKEKHLNEYYREIRKVENISSNKLLIILDTNFYIGSIPKYRITLDRISSELSNYESYHNLRSKIVLSRNQLIKKGFGKILDELDQIILFSNSYAISNYYKLDSMYDKWKKNYSIILEWVNEIDKMTKILDQYMPVCSEESELKKINWVYSKLLPEQYDYYDVNECDIKQLKLDFSRIVEYFETEIEKINSTLSIKDWMESFHITLKELNDIVIEIIRISNKISYTFFQNDVMTLYELIEFNYNFILNKYTNEKSIRLFYSKIMDIISVIEMQSQEIKSKYKELQILETEFDNAKMINEGIWKYMIEILADTEDDDLILKNKTNSLINEMQTKRVGIGMVNQNRKAKSIINEICHIRANRNNILSEIKKQEMPTWK